MTGSLHAGERKLSIHTTQDVRECLVAPPSKSLCSLSQETRLPYTMYQKAARKPKLHPYCVSVVQDFLPVDKKRRMHFVLQRLILEHSGILDLAWFTSSTSFRHKNETQTENRTVPNETCQERVEILLQSEG